MVAFGIFAIILAGSNTAIAEESNYEILRKSISHQIEKPIQKSVIGSLELKQLKNDLKSNNRSFHLRNFGLNEINEDPLYEIEPNNDFNTSNFLPNERVMIGNLLPLYDVDLFKVHLPSEGYLAVGGTTSSYAIELLFSAVEKDFEDNGFIEYLGYEYDEENDIELQLYKVHKAGTYYIGAIDSDNDFYDDNYEEDLYALVTSFVEDDKPSTPIVNEVNENSTSITGTADLGTSITVKSGGTVLGKGITTNEGKYTVSIAKQKAGTILTVTAADSSGNVSLEAKVTVVESNRIAGSTRYATAVAISKEGWQNADTVVLATGTGFPDALAGGPLAFQEDAPILLTKPTSLLEETEKEIIRLKAKKVIILGSEGAISEAVEMRLKHLGLGVERIGGENRFETAALIAKKITSDEAIIAFGYNFPDALSISPFAAKNGIPILLTRTDRVPVETLNAMSGKKKTIIVGSTGAISDAVMRQFPKPVRYGGLTRYETGKEIITKLQMGTEKAYVATGRNFPDALAGSVLAAKNNAPILLVTDKSIPSATKELVFNYDDFTIFGSEGAVGKEVEKELEIISN